MLESIYPSIICHWNACYFLHLCPFPHGLVRNTGVTPLGGAQGPWRVLGLLFITCNVSSEGDGREVAKVMAMSCAACPSLSRVLPWSPAVQTGHKAGIL